MQAPTPVNYRVMHRHREFVARAEDVGEAIKKMEDNDDHQLAGKDIVCAICKSRILGDLYDEDGRPLPKRKAGRPGHGKLRFYLLDQCTCQDAAMQRKLEFGENSDSEGEFEDARDDVVAGRVDGNGSSATRKRKLLSDSLVIQNIESFKGGDETVLESFLFAIDQAAKSNGWGQDLRFETARLKLRGDALRVVQLSKCTTWEQLCIALRARFGSRELRAVTRRRAAQCAQRGDEDVDTYAERLKTVFAKLQPEDASGLVNPSVAKLWDEMLCDRFVDGLKPSLRRAVLSKAPTSFEYARDIAVMEEQIDALEGRSARIHVTDATQGQPSKRSRNRGRRNEDSQGQAQQGQAPQGQAAQGQAGTGGVSQQAGPPQGGVPPQRGPAPPGQGGYAPRDRVYTAPPQGARYQPRNAHHDPVVMTQSTVSREPGPTQALAAPVELDVSLGLNRVKEDERDSELETKDSVETLATEGDGPPEAPSGAASPPEPENVNQVDQPEPESNAEYESSDSEESETEGTLRGVVQKQPELVPGNDRPEDGPDTSQTQVGRDGSVRPEVDPVVPDRVPTEDGSVDMDGWASAEESQEENTLLGERDPETDPSAVPSETTPVRPEVGAESDVTEARGSEDQPAVDQAIPGSPLAEDRRQVPLTEGLIRFRREIEEILSKSNAKDQPSLTWVDSEASESEKDESDAGEETTVRENKEDTVIENRQGDSVIEIEESDSEETETQAEATGARTTASGDPEGSDDKRPYEMRAVSLFPWALLLPWVATEAGASVPCHTVTYKEVRWGNSLNLTCNWESHLNETLYENVKWFGPFKHRAFFETDMSAPQVGWNLGGVNRMLRIGDQTLAYEISAASPHDEGFYQCVTYYGSKTYANCYTLTVIEPPTEIYIARFGERVSSELYVKNGHNVSLTCIVIGGTPPPEVDWYMGDRDGVKGDEKVLFTIEAAAEGVTKLELGLEERTVATNHEIYTCRVKVGTTWSQYQSVMQNMVVIVEIQGNLFEAKCSLAHCVSSDFKMSAGIAKTFKEKFGNQALLRNGLWRVGDTARLEIGNGIYVFYLVTKQRYFDHPTYNDIRAALIQLASKMGIITERSYAYYTVDKNGQEVRVCGRCAALVMQNIIEGYGTIEPENFKFGFETEEGYADPTGPPPEEKCDSCGITLYLDIFIHDEPSSSDEGADDEGIL
ncbi:hypothetical protein FOCC_FOCC014350 [Frankliniella occidentalis]|nr:hypothetical protein FOCC_FOCC014350 [Frankliniella occidentalis]